MLNLQQFKRIIILSGAGISVASGIPDFKTGGYIKPQVNYWDCECNESHQLAKKLQDMGILARVYTQNIDRLYQKAGVNDEFLVECHGNYYNGIVNYGDELDPHIFKMIQQDFIDSKPDLLLVMGTRLQVSPVCCIPNLAKTKYAIINCKADIMSNPFNSRDRMCASYIKIGKTRVSLQSKWKRHEIIEMDVAEFSKGELSSLTNVY